MIFGTNGTFEKLGVPRNLGKRDTGKFSGLRKFMKSTKREHWKTSGKKEIHDILERRSIGKNPGIQKIIKLYEKNGTLEKGVLKYWNDKILDKTRNWKTSRETGDT